MLAVKYRKTLQFIVHHSSFLSYIISYMKNTFILLAIIAIGCAKPDKKAELASLKQEAQALETKIKALEKEVGVVKVATGKIKTVAVSPLSTQKFQHYIEVQGAVEAVNTATVGAQMGGAITSVLVKEGDNVAKGQLVATIDGSILKESLEELKHQLSLATTIFDKQKALWDQQIGTEVQYIQAKGNKEAMEKRIATMQQQLAMTKVYAPISGTVEAVRQKTGEMAMPGMGIIQIVSVGALRVRAKVADTYLGAVKRGDRLVVKFPDTNQELNTQINVVAKTVNPITRTFDIEANIPNLGGQLKPNQMAVININDASKAATLVINKNLIRDLSGQCVVYVAEKEGTKKVAKARMVKTGLDYNGQIEIIEGLKAGDNVITEGYQEVTDGQEIDF